MCRSILICTLLLMAGQIVGTWSSRKRPNGLEYIPEIYGETRQILQAVEAAAERYGIFLGMPEAFGR